MRKALAIGLVVGMTMGVAATAFAVRDRNTAFGRVDRQTFRWRQVATSTASTTFEKIPDLSLVTCNKGPLAVEVGGNITGGPAEIRVVEGPGDFGKPLLPGIARYDASSEATSFSFTFAKSRGKRDHRQFDVEWRSPTGAEVTLDHALMRAIYKTPKKPCV